MRHLLKSVAIIAMVGLLTTIASYGIVTGKNVSLSAATYYSLTGSPLVSLPCEGPPGYDSTNPTVPEARGLPLNYRYYNPCDGNAIIRVDFLLDFGFWVIFYSSIYMAYRFCLRLKVAKRVH